jgi:hypothetical protein
VTAKRPVRVLVVTSAGSSGDAAMPVLAALEAAKHRVRAIDVGRVGASGGGAAWRVVKAISGELAERRLARELGASPPDVAVAFDPGSTMALLELRRHAPNPVAVLAVIGELSPDPVWGEVPADRFLAVDDEAAVALADAGVAEERVMTVGPLVEARFAAAGRSKREVLRARFGLPLSEPVILVEVEGLGHETTSQLALQLSLVGSDGVYLFAAGADVEAARALRASVPTLEMRAKLFGATDDAPLLWRCADVAVARPRLRAAMRTLAINTRMVAFLPEDDAGERLARDLEARGMGARAQSALLVASAIEPLIARPHAPSARTGADGAASVADIIAIVGGQVGAILAETARVSAAAAAAETTSAESGAAAPTSAGELEDLSAGGGLEDLFGPAAGADGAGARRKAELGAQMKQLARQVSESQTALEDWERKKAKAEGAGDSDQARQASRGADAERAKMHKALAQMAALEGEIRKLEGRDKRRPAPGRASRPSASRGAGLDDALRDLKKKQTASVEDELAALKRRMSKKGTS